MDPRSGGIRKHGIRIRLQEQPFQVLLALLETPGEVVSRDELRDRIWGADTFVDFDHGLSAAVNRLREALGDSADSPRFVETLARRGYRFIAPVEGHADPAMAPPAARRRVFWAWGAGLLLLLAGAALWFTMQARRGPDPHLVPLTTLSGFEYYPAFSPDGQQLAFAWTAAVNSNLDLYVKMIGEGEPLRLTTHPAADGFPSWSPDGRQIAFCSLRDGGGLYLIPSLGGAERKLDDLKCWDKPVWSRDGRFLAVPKAYNENHPSSGGGSLLQVAVDGSAPPRVILAAAPGRRYQSPALAPDARSLAFFECIGPQTGPSCAIQVVETGANLEPASRPRSVAEGLVYPKGLTWAPGGDHLIFGKGLGNASYLWRVGVDDGKPPARLDLAGEGAWFPDIGARHRRLAFQRALSDPDIWRIAADGQASPLITSSVREVGPQYSPDGRRVAFESDRGGGNLAVWIAEADGSGLRQVTRLPSPISGTPRWSPDGRRIAFDSLRPDGGWDTWVVDESGTNSKLLTQGPSDNVVPSWSRDGRWVYFASNRTGRFEVWKVLATGGAALQVTKNGGSVAFESADGKRLYYTRGDPGAGGLFEKALPDGEERPLVSEAIVARGFAVFPDGVYYLTRKGPGPVQIRWHDFAARTSRTVHLLPGPGASGPSSTVRALAFGFSVSPDRKNFLFSPVTSMGSDLMMIENFE